MHVYTLPYQLKSIFIKSDKNRRVVQKGTVKAAMWSKKKYINYLYSDCMSLVYVVREHCQKSIEKHLTHIKLNIVCVCAVPCLCFSLTVMNVVCACLSFPLYFILLFLFSWHGMNVYIFVCNMIILLCVYAHTHTIQRTTCRIFIELEIWYTRRKKPIFSFVMWKQQAEFSVQVKDEERLMYEEHIILYFQVEEYFIPTLLLPLVFCLLFSYTIHMQY